MKERKTRTSTHKKEKEKLVSVILKAEKRQNNNSIKEKGLLEFSLQK
jgi:hypothetical protein